MSYIKIYLYNRTTKLLVLVIFFFQLGFSQVKTFNVKDYGAKGDGIGFDDSFFERCINAAISETSAKIIVPKGLYKLNKTIKIPLNYGQEIIIEGIDFPQLHFVNKDQGIGLKVFATESNPNSGKINFQGLYIKGPQLGFGKKNSFFNTVRHLYGIGISGISSVVINNCKIENFYGNGIDVSNKGLIGNKRKYQFRSVLIKNSSVINCWGKSPSVSYGDGIYLSNCSNFILDNNIVNNNFNVTNWLGRGGIVVENDTRNGKIVSNSISGYRRGIHIENSNGGISIVGNKMFKNYTGVFVWAESSPTELPIIIKKNDISLENMKEVSRRFKDQNNEFFFARIKRPKKLLNKDKFVDNILKTDGSNKILEQNLQVDKNFIDLSNNIIR